MISAATAILMRTVRNLINKKQEAVLFYLKPRQIGTWIHISIATRDSNLLSSFSVHNADTLQLYLHFTLYTPKTMSVPEDGFHNDFQALLKRTNKAAKRGCSFRPIFHQLCGLYLLV